MSENTLGAIFEDQAPADEPATEAVETEQVETQPEQTGEHVEASPAEPEQKEDPIERHRKGLEAAVLAERRRRQELEAQLAAFQQQQAPKQAEDGPPDPSQYTDTATYIRDVARWEARQQYQAERAQAEEQAKARQVEAQRQEMQRVAQASVAKGQAKYPDFDAAINTGLAPFLNPVLQQALVLSEDGHDVAYYLAKNPAEAARVAAMHPMQMAVEVGRLASKVQAPSRPEIPKTLTQARDSRGQFAGGYAGPTPLDAILSSKR